MVMVEEPASEGKLKKFATAQVSNTDDFSQDQTPRALFFSGVWPLFAWMYFFSVNLEGKRDSGILLPAAVDVYLFILIASAVLVVLARRWSPDRVVDNRFSFICGAGMFVGTVIVVFSDTLPLPTLWLVVGSVLGGIGCAWGYADWGAFFSTQGPRESTKYLLTAMIISCGVKLVLSLLGANLSCLVSSVFPLLSFLLLARVRNCGTEGKVAADVYYHHITDVASLWRIALCVAFTVFLCSIVSASSASFGYNRTQDMLLISSAAARVVNIVVLGIVLWWITVMKGSFSFSQLWDIASLSLGASLVFFAFPQTIVWGLALSGATLDFMVVFLCLTLSDVSRHSDLSPYCLFGAGWLVYASFRFFGKYTAAAYGSYLAFSAQAYLIMLFAVMLMVRLCLGTGNASTQRIFSDMNVAEPKIADFDSIDKRCQMLAEQYGLTARELEVMQMLCKGRTRTYIAETLFISPNTVKGHVKKVYVKLGIHNRTELQSALELSE